MAQELATGWVKTCNGCGRTKALCEFGVRPERPSGVRSKCKECSRRATAKYKALNPEKEREYRLANRDRGNERSREWRAANPERNRATDRACKERNRDRFRALERERFAANAERVRERKRLHRERNAEAYRAREAAQRERNRDAIRDASRRSCAKRRATPRGKLENTVRVRINKELRPGSKSGRKTFELLGYTADDLRVHLERQFVRGMTWENYSHRGWHVDHIVPVAAFDYETPDDPAFKACWALTNLRPLWAVDNISKGGKRLTLL
jgi:hypothetical protein